MIYIIIIIKQVILFSITIDDEQGQTVAFSGGVVRTIIFPK